VVRVTSLVALLSTLAVVPAAAASQSDLSDASIESAVERELGLQEGVSSLEIDAEVKNGVVTLTGSASHLLARQRAVDIARRVKGVMSVVDETTLDMPPRSDAAIMDDVDRTLVLDPAVNSMDVLILVEDGTVSLSGEVDSWQERWLAAKQARTVRAVVDVENDIEVSDEADRSDNDIERDIEQALKWNVAIDDALIDADVRKGKVKLTGTVGSAAEKDHAERLAWVRGVQQVKNKLDVEWWAEDEKLRKGALPDRSNDAVEAAIGRALWQDPRVMASKVDVRVKDGYATLSGTARTLQARQAAERDARNTVGVWGVENLIRVRPVEEMDDESVESRVEDVLQHDPWLAPHDLTVKVEDNRAMLYGEVPTHWDEARASQLAASVTGVTAIDEEIEVDDVEQGVWMDPVQSGWVLTPRSDAEIRKRVEDHLFWNPFLETDEVEVSVEDGTVTLEGTVDTWFERFEATEEALDGGANVVDNDLEVVVDSDMASMGN
jgi:osmotically-inducible protein OsmY